MKRASVRVTLLAVVASLALAPVASAQVFFSDAGIAGSSWTVEVGHSGWTAHDVIEIFIIGDTGAGPFNGTGMFDISAPGWSATVVNPNYILASGPSTSGFDWSLDFAGNMAQSVQMDLLSWTGGGYGVGSLPGAPFPFLVTFGYTNGGFQWNGQWGPGQLTYPDGSGYNRDVPEPSTLALLIPGLVVTYAIWRRRRQA